MGNRLQMVFLAVVLGLLLTIIGIGVSSEWVYLIGVLIMPLALLWGGLFLQGENLAMRIAMMAVAGVIIAAKVLSGGGMSYFM